MTPDPSDRLPPLDIPVITITQTEYKELKKDQELLNALRAAGVDNWEGWDIVMEEMYP